MASWRLKSREFPGTTKDVILELMGHVSGEIEDQALRVNYPQALNYSGLTPVTVASGIDLQGVGIRGTAGMTPGWRLAAGAFAIDGAVENALLLISPELEVVRHWILDEIPVGDMEPPAEILQIRPRGRDLAGRFGNLHLRRQYLAATLRQMRAAALGDPRRDGGVSPCRHPRQRRPICLDLQRKQQRCTCPARRTGWFCPNFSMQDIIAANPEIDILGIRQVHDNDLGRNSRNTSGDWMEDPFHLNDVDPLPARLADRFPGFEAGDLLISARSLNMVFVVDPDDLKIKWWRAGAVQRQHDPDWSADGSILIFNNRMSRDYSEIVTIDPETFEKRVLLDGRDYDFYTRIRGQAAAARVRESGRDQPAAGPCLRG